MKILRWAQVLVVQNASRLSSRSIDHIDVQDYLSEPQL